MEYFNCDSHQERLNRCNSLRQEPSTPTSWGDDGDDGVDDNDDDDVDDDEGTALKTPTHFGRSQCMWPV